MANPPSPKRLRAELLAAVEEATVEQLQAAQPFLEKLRTALQGQARARLEELEAFKTVHGQNAEVVALVVKLSGIGTPPSDILVMEAEDRVTALEQVQAEVRRRISLSQPV